MEKLKLEEEIYKKYGKKKDLYEIYFQERIAWLPVKVLDRTKLVWLDVIYEVIDHRTNEIKRYRSFVTAYSEYQKMLDGLD